MMPTLLLLLIFPKCSSPSSHSSLSIIPLLLVLFSHSVDLLKFCKLYQSYIKLTQRCLLYEQMIIQIRGESLKRENIHFVCKFVIGDMGMCLLVLNSCCHRKVVLTCYILISYEIICSLGTQCNYTPLFLHHGLCSITVSCNKDCNR